MKRFILLALTILTGGAGAVILPLTQRHIDDSELSFIASEDAGKMFEIIEKKHNIIVIPVKLYANPTIDKTMLNALFGIDSSDVEFYADKKNHRGAAQFIPPYAEVDENGKARKRPLRGRPLIVLTGPSSGSKIAILHEFEHFLIWKSMDDPTIITADHERVHFVTVLNDHARVYLRLIESYDKRPVNADSDLIEKVSKNVSVSIKWLTLKTTLMRYSFAEEVDVTWLSVWANEKHGLGLTDEEIIAELAYHIACFRKLEKQIESLLLVMNGLKKCHAGTTASDSEKKELDQSFKRVELLQERMKPLRQWGEGKLAKMVGPARAEALINHLKSVISEHNKRPQ